MRIRNPSRNASKVLKLRKFWIIIHFTGGEVSECVAAAWEGSSQRHHQTLQRGEGLPVSWAIVKKSSIIGSSFFYESGSRRKFFFISKLYWRYSIFWVFVKVLSAFSQQRREQPALKNLCYFYFGHFCRTNSGFWIPDQDSGPSLNWIHTGTAIRAPTIHACPAWSHRQFNRNPYAELCIERIRFRYFCLNKGHSFNVGNQDVL
jgi:hypothetical protein